ncbi:hypothetical protein [Cupriavidus alkaliphilus]|uniref:hypothetical protein n=1 Tax=Cupriavidus alkaliphilus TaxID=942866 RepID=UPI00160D3BEA|nr:hypothetical protein [Cupriavidus alkaliphilus]MBB3016879.1 hypothetical protein [Cupriavidus alkaliphilus]
MQSIIKSKLGQKLAIVASLFTVAGAANAQTASTTAAGFQAIFTGAAADFATLIGYAITLAVAVWGGLVVFKLAKKLYNKAT